MRMLLCTEGDAETPVEKPSRARTTITRDYDSGAVVRVTVEVFHDDSCAPAHPGSHPEAYQYWVNVLRGAMDEYTWAQFGERMEAEAQGKTK